MGLGLCHLCKNSSEENENLFIHCIFTKSIWLKIRSIKNIRYNWDGVDLDDCLTSWIKRKTNSTILAALICWHIWMERNVAIFEGKTPSVQSIVIKSLGALQNPMVKLITSSI
jgi:hypothetical protein